LIFVAFYFLYFYGNYRLKIEKSVETFLNSSKMSVGKKRVCVSLTAVALSFNYRGNANKIRN